MAKRFLDNFEDGTVSLSLWDETTDSDGGVVSESGGELILDPDHEAGSGSGWASIESDTTHALDLIGSEWLTEITAHGFEGADVQFTLKIRNQTFNDNDMIVNYIVFNGASSTNMDLEVWSVTGASWTEQYAQEWDPTDEAWIRYREAGGTTYVDTGDSEANFSNVVSFTNISGANWDYTALRLKYSADVFNRPGDLHVCKFGSMRFGKFVKDVAAMGVIPWTRG